MQDLVNDALEECSSVEETEADPAPAEEFGPPRCAVVGCGFEGVNRLEQFTAVDSIDAEITKVAVARDSTLESASTKYDEAVRVPISRDRAGASVIDAGKFEQAVDNRFDNIDIVVVTGHLHSVVSARSIEAVCESMSSEQLILAVPTIPPDGLCDEMTPRFCEIVRSAGTTIPYDHQRILDSYASLSADDVSAETIHQTVDSMIADWVHDVFELFSGPMTVPIDYAGANDLLRNGDVALLYRGWSSRSEGPDTLLEDAAAHRVCDGDRSTTDGTLGLLRFGNSFTLAEFETLEDRVMDRIAPASSDRRRWFMSGQSDSELGETYQLGLLLTGVNPESLSFTS